MQHAHTHTHTHTRTEIMMICSIHTYTHTQVHTTGSPMRTFFSLAYRSLSVSNKSPEKTRQGFEPTIHLIVYRLSVNNRHKCTQT